MAVAALMMVGLLHIMILMVMVMIMMVVMMMMVVVVMIKLKKNALYLQLPPLTKKYLNPKILFFLERLPFSGWPSHSVEKLPLQTHLVSSHRKNPSTVLLKLKMT